MADNILLIRLTPRFAAKREFNRSNDMKRFDRMMRRGCTSAGVILVAVLAWPMAGWSQTARCKPVPGLAGLVCQQIEAWGQALQESWQRIHHYPVLDKYASDAILLPTCSGDAAIGRADIRRYFVEKFLPAEPRLTAIGTPTAGQAGVPAEPRLTSIGTPTAGQAGDVIFGSGEYEFTLKDRQGKDVTVPARYTYIFQRTGNAYLIVQHHSSLEPLNPASRCP